MVAEPEKGKFTIRMVHSSSEAVTIGCKAHFIKCKGLFTVFRDKQGFLTKIILTGDDKVLLNVDFE